MEIGKKASLKLHLIEIYRKLFTSITRRELEEATTGIGKRIVNEVKQ